MRTLIFASEDPDYDAMSFESDYPTPSHISQMPRSYNLQPIAPDIQHPPLAFDGLRYPSGLELSSSPSRSTAISTNVL